LVLGLDVRRVDRELLLNADNSVVDVQVATEVSVGLTFVHILDKVVDHFYFELKIVLGLVILESLEISACIGLVWKMVDETDFSWFYLEFIVFFLTDDDTLPFILKLVIVTVFKLFVETEFIVLDYFMLVVYLVVFIHPLTGSFILAYYEMFKVIVLHLTLEFILYFFL